MPWDERQRQYLQAMGLRLWDAAVARQATAPVEPAEPEIQARQQLAAKAAAGPAAVSPASESHPAIVSPSPPAAQGPLTRMAAENDPTRLQRISALDWAGLASEVAACQACGLCQSRRQAVFGTGHPRARWLIVGEAPGEQEDLQGEPFVGPAGQLLDRMLAALELTRSVEGDVPVSRRVYIANTLKCRPPRNRNPEPVELQRCEPFLQRQIALLQPAIVLAMGRFAVQALLRSDLAIGRLRGQVHEWQGLPLVVTYHPAYLLRNPADKSKAWEDLCLAAEAAAPRLRHD